jgi:N-acetylglucosamine kinase-like BadF-type ATPase
MEQHLYVIGIDGGGTKTSAVLCALDGTILSESQGGPSNLQIVGIENSSKTIIELIETCCHSIGCSVSQIGVIVAGLAGAGRPADQKLIKDTLFDIAYKRKHSLNTVVIESDARIALEGAFSGKPGIILISGTGSIVFGKDERGKTFRAGGWGKLICDEGSGYTIGKEAFRAVAKSLDGFNIRTILVKLFEMKFDLGTQESIIKALYKDSFDIASVVPVVMEAASKGDKIAKNILIQASSELVETVRVLTANMNKGKRKKRPLAMTGTLLSGKNIYSHIVRSHIKKKIPTVSICEPESSPVVGAALMAVKELKN